VYLWILRDMFQLFDPRHCFVPERCRVTGNLELARTLDARNAAIECVNEFLERSDQIPIRSNHARRAAAVKRGATIFAQGDPATGVMYVDEGSVRVSVLSQDGKEVFMNKFRKLGFIEYNGGVKVNMALLSVVLRD
jgi:hypothetical protein